MMSYGQIPLFNNVLQDLLTTIKVKAIFHWKEFLKSALSFFSWRIPKSFLKDKVPEFKNFEETTPSLKLEHKIGFEFLKHEVSVLELPLLFIASHYYKTDFSRKRSLSKTINWILKIEL
ncbi:MAG: hypothetical protein K2Y08_00915 [Alphaproteobacteria bacterium]|nr:hypothetical protein [Alphaproteobacteria bacterium]